MSNQQKTNSNYALILLTTIFALGYADRSVINLLLDSIKSEFQLTDTILGLITGFGFALFQVTLGIPVARWADKGKRVDILSGGLLLWSAMTALCGRVSSAWQLAFARMGVGVGESALVAPSHSLLSDFFSKNQRPRAFSILSSGGDMGIIVGTLIGGWVGEIYGWRMAFLVAGIPGLIMAAVFYSTVHEPARTTDNTAAPLVLEPIGITLNFLWSQKSYVLAVIGGALIGLTLFPMQVWAPAFLRRVHHLNSAEIGSYISIARIFSIVGAIGGGFWAQHLCERNELWRLRFPAIACLLTAPAILIFLFSDSVTVAMLGFALSTLTIGAHLGSVFAFVQTVVRPRMRAMSSAIYMFTTSLIGSGLGSLAVGSLSDALKTSYGDVALRYALLLPVIMAVIAALTFWWASSFATQNISRIAEGETA